ncbi:MAG: DUF1836 domain-containing protein [Beduini sp.]|uniref:DUF1836 domain-containing protein n=1 Tax=Beduini sp. TaxID=1922300 RepID=UPI0039A29166
MTDGFTEIVHKILQRSDVHADAIPSLDLYIDQIITLLDQELGNNKRNEKDKILTKTMVNNYSKQGILKPIKGKKYSKDHIIQMLIIYSLKNTLSIEEIKRILQPIYKLSDENNVDLSHIYDHYLELKEDKKEVMAVAIDTILRDEKLNLAQDEDRLVMVLCLCALSEFSKSVAQELIDQYYPVK